MAGESEVTEGDLWRICIYTFFNIFQNRNE